MATSSRGKLWRPAFDAGVPADNWSAENLEAFIKQAGPTYVNDYEAQKAGVISRLWEGRIPGYASMSEDQRKTARAAPGHSTFHMTGPYRKALADFRYEYVKALYNAGRLASAGTQAALAAPVTKTAAKSFKKADAEALVAAHPNDPAGLRAAFAALNISPDVAETQALEIIGKALGMSSAINSIKAAPGLNPRTTEGFRSRKTQIIQTILTGAAPAIAIAVSPAVVSGVLQQSGIRSAAELQGRTVAQLRSLASAAGISSRDVPDRKEAIVATLSRAAGLQGMRSKEEMTIIVRDMIARLFNASATVDQIKDEARQYLADELEKVDHDTMKQLSKLLALSFRNEVTGKAIAPSRKAIVMALTGAQSQTSLSREGRKSLRNDRGACRTASIDEVRLVAKSHNIPTFGVSHVELCDKLYAQYLTNASELVLGSAEKLVEYARLAPVDRQKKIRALVAQLHLDVPAGERIETISQLLNHWVLTHYKARAMNLYPRLVAVVEDYLMGGNIPQSASDRHSLGVIFSDIDRRLPSMSDNEITNTLGNIYANFLARLASEDDAQTLQAFNQYRDKVGFGTYSEAGSPPRTRARSPSPVRVRTPRISPVILPAQVPLPGSPLLEFGSPISSSPRSRASSPPRRAQSPRSLPVVLPPAPVSPRRTPSPRVVLPAEEEEFESVLI